MLRILTILLLTLVTAFSPAALCGIAGGPGCETSTAASCSGDDAGMPASGHHCCCCDNAGDDADDGGSAACPCCISNTPTKPLRDAPATPAPGSKSSVLEFTLATLDSPAPINWPGTENAIVKHATPATAIPCPPAPRLAILCSWQT